MNLYYNGVDIYGDVSVNYCVHEMFAEKQADTLVIRFNDTKGTWSKWQPAEGDTVQFKEGASDTGKMFVHSMKPENGLFTIRAMSMPKSGKTKKSKSWEGVRFLQLANEFAGNHGLTFQNYGCTDQVTRISNRTTRQTSPYSTGSALWKAAKCLYLTASCWRITSST